MGTLPWDFGLLIFNMVTVPCPSSRCPPELTWETFLTVTIWVLTLRDLGQGQDLGLGLGLVITEIVEYRENLCFGICCGI